LFIAHIPASYILIKETVSRLPRFFSQARPRRLVVVALVASIFPDLDLIYFYVFDGRQSNHHSYWTHIPLYWLLIAVIVFIVLKGLKRSYLTPYVVTFFISIVLHLVLDSMVGGIMWFYPFSLNLLSLVEIKASAQWWVLNFIWHWTFGIELLLVYLAVLKWVVTRRGSDLREYNLTLNTEPLVEAKQSIAG